MFSELRKRVKKAGMPPGTLTYTGEKKNVVPTISVITYSADTFHEVIGTELQKCLPADKLGKETLWLNVVGLRDTALISDVAQCYNLHPLTVEDILNVEQRSKVEEFDDYIYVTLKMLLWNEKKSNFTIEQFSMALGKNFVLSFQEMESGLFDTLHEKFNRKSGQRLREKGSDYLAYRLIDIIVDQYFVVLERIGDQIEKIEERLIATPTQQNSRNIYRLKRQLMTLRKAVWPMREAISHLMQAEGKLITSFTRLYLRDVYDHVMQAIDTVETFRDMLSSMLDLYLSSLTNRMNEIMKVLTIISTIFIPITFVASIYGMNFEHMPELHSRWGYPMVLSIMLAVVIVMLVYFRRKKWI